MNRTSKYTGCLLACLLVLAPCRLVGQDSIPAVVKDNIYARSRVVDETTIKLRWAPSNTKAWIDGKKVCMVSIRQDVLRRMLTFTNSSNHKAKASVGSPALLTVSHTRQDVTCYNGYDGWIKVEAGGGSGGYKR